MRKDKLDLSVRNLWENAKRQVWNTVLKREAAGMGPIHVCVAYVAPCDDPEGQMVVPIDSDGSRNFSMGGMAA